jgi:hypothetical protein
MELGSALIPIFSSAAGAFESTVPKTITSETKKIKSGFMFIVSSLLDVGPHSNFQDVEFVN